MSSDICANCHFSIALHPDMFGHHQYAGYGVCRNFTPTPPRRRPATVTQFDWVECEACRKPILRGQFVHAYDDVGEVHVDCAKPFAISDDPAAFILAGEPMQRLRASVDGRRMAETTEELARGVARPARSREAGDAQ